MRRLILGGVQENVVLCFKDLIRRHCDEVLSDTGPPPGPEGSQVQRARAGGVSVEPIAGKPVVSYDVDGARAVAIPAQTGCLISVRCDPDMAAALGRLAAEKSPRDRPGTEGRRRFTDVFRHERMTEQIRVVYVKLLERRHDPEENGRDRGDWGVATPGTNTVADPP